MTIQELINKFSKCKNKNIPILITLGNECEDILSTSIFEVFSENENEYLEIFIDNDNYSKQI